MSLDRYTVRYSNTGYGKFIKGHQFFLENYSTDLEVICLVEADLHSRDLPCIKHSLQNMLRGVIGDEVKMKGITPVKQHALDESDDIPCGVITSTHNGYVKHLKQTRWMTVMTSCVEL